MMVRVMSQLRRARFDTQIWIDFTLHNTTKNLYLVYRTLVSASLEGPKLSFHNPMELANMDDFVPDQGVSV